VGWAAKTKTMEQKIQTACLLILTSIGVAMALSWLRPLLIPFVLALFIYLGLSVALDVQTRWFRIPRPVALLTTVVGTVVLFLVLGAIVSASVRELSANMSGYEANVNALAERLTTMLPIEGFRFSRESVLKSLTEISGSSVSEILRQTANAIATLLSRSLLVLLIVIFLLIGSGKGSATSVHSELRNEVVWRVTRYIVVKAAVSGVTGCLVGLSLYLLGVDLALVFGLFAFLLNIIPTLGSIVATLLPLPVVLVSPGISTTTAVLAILIPGSIQLVIGSFIEPKIMGESLDLHPITVLLALIFWGMLWGIIGALLATPMTAVAKILFDKFEPAQPFAELMAGRVPGTAAAAPAASPSADENGDP